MELLSICSLTFRSGYALAKELSLDTKSTGKDKWKKKSINLLLNIVNLKYEKLSRIMSKKPLQSNMQSML